MNETTEDIRKDMNELNVGTFAARVQPTMETLPQSLKDACPNWETGELLAKVCTTINTMTEQQFNTGAWKLVGSVLYECHYCGIELDELPAQDVKTAVLRLKSCYLKSLGQVWKTYEGVYPRTQFLPIGITTVVAQIGQQIKKQVSDKEELDETQRRPLNAKSLAQQMKRGIVLDMVPVECQATQSQMDHFQLEAEKRSHS